MTDNEIKKALECCLGEEYHCDNCPYQCDKHFNKKTLTFDTMPNGMSYDQLSCDEWLKKDALDLINRLQAENERLRANNKATMQTIADVHTEAIKDFAERLKEKAKSNEWNGTICGNDIDNLLKELVGEDK